MQHCRHSEQMGFTSINLRSLDDFGDRQLPSKRSSDFNVRFLARSALMIPFMDLASDYLLAYWFLTSVIERGLSVSLSVEDEKC